MKIGLINDGSERCLAARNLLVQEGVEFRELAKDDGTADVLVSPHFIRRKRGWLISYPQEGFDAGRLDGMEGIKIAGRAGSSIILKEPIFDLLLNSYKLNHAETSADALRREFYMILDYIAKAEGKELVTKWYYPCPKRSAIALTLDIDHLQQYRNIFVRNRPAALLIKAFPHKKLIAYLMRRLRPGLRYSIFPSVLSYVELYGMRSTLFVRPSLYQKEEKLTGRGGYVPDDRMKGTGHEIGLHFGATLGKYSLGFIDPNVYSDPTEPWIEGITRGKKSLGRLDVRGCRSHHCHLWIPDSLEQMEGNFAYDSSLYAELALHHKRVFEDRKSRYANHMPVNGMSYPFYPVYNGKMYSFLEIPVTHYECYDRKKIAESMDAIGAANGIVVGLYHPTVDLGGISHLLGRAGQDVWKTTLAEIAKWVAFRNRAVVNGVPVQRIGGDFDRGGLVKVGAFHLRVRGKYENTLHH